MPPAAVVLMVSVCSAQKRTNLREHSPPIFATSSFTYDSAEQAAAVFAEQEPGYVYSRFTNPTVEAFEQRLAGMEGGDACVATASGMAAEMALLMTLLKSGDHVLASRTLFGSTLSLFNNYFTKFGVEFSYVDPTVLDAWRLGLRRNTKLPPRCQLSYL